MTENAPKPKIDGIYSTSKPKTGYIDFELRYIWWGLAIALFGGFAVGAHSISVIAYQFPVRPNFVAYNQLHGHLQFIGWAGLFIVGISLHVIPRFAGIPLPKPKHVQHILFLLVTGLVVRFIAHSFIPYFLTGATWMLLAAALIFSGACLLLAVVLYVNVLFSVLRRAVKEIERPALPAVAPFFFMVLFGWVGYALANFSLLIEMTFRSGISLHPHWDYFLVAFFLSFVLLPICFAFSIRMLPLYLRLPIINWPVRRVAGVFLLGVLVYLLPIFGQAAGVLETSSANISHIGLLIRNGAILWLIWKLDILTRARQSWVEYYKLEFSADRRPTRPGMPDYGEFGRFELLIYAAYFWLAMGALFESINTIALLLGNPPLWYVDAIRHMYLMGFITHLIFGMAPRMIPAFVKVKRIRYPNLVLATFYLGMLATVGRVVPYLLPFSIRQQIVPVEQFFLGFSGVFAMIAILCLWINLHRSIKHPVDKSAAKKR